MIEIFTQSSKQSLLILLILTFLYFLENFDRYLIAVSPIPYIDYGSYEYSILAGPAFAVVYTVGGLFFALGYTDYHNNTHGNHKYSKFAILSFSTFLFSLSFGLTALAQNFWQQVIIRIVMGLAQSIITPFSTSLIKDYFTTEIMGSALGIFNTGVYFAFALSLSLGIFIYTEYGWQAGYYLFGLIGIGGSFLLPLLSCCSTPPTPNETYKYVSVDESDLDGSSIRGSTSEKGSFFLYSSTTANPNHYHNPPHHTSSIFPGSLQSSQSATPIPAASPALSRTNTGTNFNNPHHPPLPPTSLNITNPMAKSPIHNSEMFLPGPVIMASNGDLIQIDEDGKPLMIDSHGNPIRTSESDGSRGSELTGSEDEEGIRKWKGISFVLPSSSSCPLPSPNRFKSLLIEIEHRNISGYFVIFLKYRNISAGSIRICCCCCLEEMFRVVQLLSSSIKEEKERRRQEEEEKKQLSFVRHTNHQRREEGCSSSVIFHSPYETPSSSSNPQKNNTDIGGYPRYLVLGGGWGLISFLFLSTVKRSMQNEKRKIAPKNQAALAILSTKALFLGSLLCIGTFSGFLSGYILLTGHSTVKEFGNSVRQGLRSLGLKPSLDETGSAGGSRRGGEERMGNEEEDKESKEVEAVLENLFQSLTETLSPSDPSAKQPESSSSSPSLEGKKIETFQDIIDLLREKLKKKFEKKSKDEKEKEKEEKKILKEDEKEKE